MLITYARVAVTSPPLPSILVHHVFSVFGIFVVFMFFDRQFFFYFYRAFSFFFFFGFEHDRIYGSVARQQWEYPREKTRVKESIKKKNVRETIDSMFGLCTDRSCVVVSTFFLSSILVIQLLHLVFGVITLLTPSFGRRRLPRVWSADLSRWSKMFLFSLRNTTLSPTDKAAQLWFGGPAAQFSTIQRH